MSSRLKRHWNISLFFKWYNVHKNGLPKNQKELKENTQNYMESLQKNPQKVANFFLHPSVKYAS